MEKIFYLKLGEHYLSNGILVLRVPGGWIFTQGKYEDSSGDRTSVFVPFSTEFKD